MKLILGPPGAGKTVSCLIQLKAALGAKLDSCRLIVPTATMAEHLRNELAREGFVFKPAIVSTFTKFTEPYCLATPAVTSGAIEILVKEVLARISLTTYAGVRDFAGFRASIVRSIEEFSSAGGTLENLTNASAEPDFVRVYAGVLAALKERNLYLRSSQLKHAVDKITQDGCPGVEELVFAGFYSFTAPELGVIRALASKVRLTIALSEWAGAQPTIADLSQLATSIVRLNPAAPLLNRTLCVAPTLDAEVSEIARRIIQAHENGRPWREMGVIVRSEGTYVPALRSAFHRFGIPSRFYFSSALTDAPAVRYLRALVNALLTGWDYVAMLRALRLPGSALEANAKGDRFEFELLQRAPGSGLEVLREIGDDETKSLADRLDTLSPWVDAQMLPRTWAARMRTLRSLYTPAEMQDGCSHEVALLWRSHAAALDGFETACDAAAEALDPAIRIDCRQFWDAVETVLSSSELRVADHRRDVVHVIDAFEARQWSLPIVFVCLILCVIGCRHKVCNCARATSDRQMNAFFSTWR